jgi:hypothetical protein
MLDHQLLTIFVTSCIALMVLALGFGIKSWIISLQRTITSLDTSIMRMTQVIANLEKEQAVQRVMIAANGRELRKLESQSCTRGDCPFKDKPLHPHQRLTDLQSQMDEITDAGLQDGEVNG